MEDWKAGRMEDWKVGRAVNWEIGAINEIAAIKDCFDLAKSARFRNDIGGGGLWMVRR